ncbi:type IV pilus twitching motility protein PilT [Tolypothrix sp. VBCCA 56010]|uniref:type IV pilus twitching motility protein PilT n=1 Tax=Tolypothrix sp. VBCCA 56010 TaxID=3137731 RepID=UPI003D7D28E9
MTESQRPANSTPIATRNIPPLPPPPPASLSTQRQATQTLDMTLEKTANRAGMMNAAPPPPPAEKASHRPGTPPPMPGAVPRKSSSGMTLAQLIKEAYDKGFSDIHLGVGEVPRFRNRGEMQPTEYPETDKETFISWVREVLTEGELKHFEEHLEFDGATQYDFARVRINIFDSLKGYAMVMRLIPLKILTIDQLNLPPVFRDICHYHKGLILVTGPTGSGKSTTMAAMVDYINKEMAKHIITIEDPIEFVHKSQKSLVKQREVGMHTRKFDNALKAALREDPDLILVGEMRDKETVNTALKAAQTGHLVMGTLHTNSAVKTIERILNLFSAGEQDAMRVALAESLVAVIAQGLCRTTDGKRAAFHDILINTDAVKDWVKDGKYDEISELMKQAGFDGMITMNQSLLNLYQEGRITEETALEMSPTPNEMAQFLRGRV